MSARQSRSHKRRHGPAPVRRTGSLLSSSLPSRGVVTFAAVGLFTATLTLYWPTRAFDFVWDDLAYHLAANNGLMGGDTATFWRQPYKDFYSPVTYTTWTY